MRTFGRESAHAWYLDDQRLEALTNALYDILYVATRSSGVDLQLNT
jgi:hypothetical protein